MAGQPITAEYCKRLEAYGLERILDRIIDGEFMHTIAADPAIRVSRPFLSRWLNGTLPGSKNPKVADAVAERRELYDQARALHDQALEIEKQKAAERKRQYAEALELSADAIVEDGARHLEEETDPRMSQLRAAQAAFRLKLAQTRNRQKYGEPKTKVEVNIAVQHLDALRRRQVTATVVVQAPLEDGGPDVELLPAGSSETGEDQT